MRPYGRVSLTRLMYDYFGVWLLELLCQESNWSDHLWSDQTSSIPVNCLASSPFLDHPRLLLQQMHQFSRMKRSCGELGNRVFAQRCMFAALHSIDACLDDWVVSMVNLAEGIDPLSPLGPRTLLELEGLTHHRWIHLHFVEGDRRWLRPCVVFHREICTLQGATLGGQTPCTDGALQGLLL